MYIKTSSRENKNVKEAFYTLSREVNAKRDMMERRVSFSINSKSINNNSKEKLKTRRKNCCRQQ